MESSTCLPPTMLCRFGGAFFGACAARLLRPSFGPDTAPVRLVQASELLLSPRCYHQDLLTIAPNGGITGFFFSGECGRGETRQERNALESTGQQPGQGCRELDGGSRRRSVDDPRQQDK